MEHDPTFVNMTSQHGLLAQEPQKGTHERNI